MELEQRLNNLGFPSLIDFVEKFEREDIQNLIQSLNVEKGELRILYNLAFSKLNQKIPERVSKVEAQIAESWALKTSEDFETKVKEGITFELKSYFLKLLIPSFIAGLGLLAGSGLLLIRSGISEGVRNVQKNEIERATSFFKDEFRREIDRTKWERHHETGMGLLYMLELAKHISFKNENEKLALYNKLYDRATESFFEAQNADPDRPESFFEIGRLNYLFPRFILGINPTENRFNRKTAEENYLTALTKYNHTHRAEDWDHEAHIHLAYFYFDQFQESGNPEDLRNCQKHMKLSEGFKDSKSKYNLSQEDLQKRIKNL